MTTYTFNAALDGGLGGDTTITAESILEAVIQAIDWAADGDWSNAQENTEDCYGGCGDVSIHVWREDDDGEIIEEECTSYTIPTLGDLLEQELDDVGEVLAERSGEWETEQIVRVGEDFYHRVENGGDRGAHDRQGGDGVWRDYPVQGAELLTRTEARAKLLDMGVEPAEVARLTRGEFPALQAALERQRELRLVRAENEADRRALMRLPGGWPCECCGTELNKCAANEEWFCCDECSHRRISDEEITEICMRAIENSERRKEKRK